VRRARVTALRDTPLADTSRLPLHRSLEQICEDVDRFAEIGVD
jgi:hypothetical protein